MITKLKVIESVKESDVIEKVDFVRVTVDLLDEKDEVVDTRRLSFPLTSTSEEIEVELQKYVEAQKAEDTMKEENKEKDAIDKQADEVIESLLDLELVVPDEPDKEKVGSRKGSASKPNVSSNTKIAGKTRRSAK